MITSGPGRILIANKPAIDCRVEDFSHGGARLQIAGMLCIPDSITLDFGDTQKNARVAWRALHEVGVKFVG
ncbi:MAG: hypothetical protein K2Y56_18090 [Methylobacterium sp.]|nr:hypothetical protein [Methylobacterium sp.]MBX9933417.1 hypothetical protein [Methylobacterium sp.]